MDPRDVLVIREHRWRGVGYSLTRFNVHPKPVLPEEPGLCRIVLGLPPQEATQRDVAKAAASIPSLTCLGVVSQKLHQQAMRYAKDFGSLFLRALNLCKGRELPKQRFR